MIARDLIAFTLAALRRGEGAGLLPSPAADLLPSPARGSGVGGEGKP